MSAKQSTGLRHLAKGAGDSLVTFLFLTILYGSVLYILDRAFRLHWLLVLLPIGFYGFAVYMGILDLRSPEAKEFPLRKGLGIFALLVLVGTSLFGALSLMLNTIGWANYTSTFPLDLVTFNYHYLWIFFDMLPGVKVTETLGLNAPVQMEGFFAGLPVLAFRIFVIYVLLKGLKAWWSSRSEVEAKA